MWSLVNHVRLYGPKFAHMTGATRGKPSDGPGAHASPHSLPGSAPVSRMLSPSCTLAGDLSTVHMSRLPTLNSMALT